MKARVPPVFLDLLNGTFEEGVDAHSIQPIYTLHLARSAGLKVTVRIDGEDVVFQTA